MMLSAGLSRRDFLRCSSLAAGALWMPGGAARAATGAPAGGAPKTPGKSNVTFLSGMAGRTFEQIAQRHVELGLPWMDLKDGLGGQTINDLGLDAARRAAEVARARGLRVFCFSTALCASPLNEGESAFRRQHHATLDHVLKLADILQPTHIRLISASLKPFPQDVPAMTVVERDFPWVFAAYREMVDRIVDSGRRVLIENETNVIFDRPEGIVRFFERLERPGKAAYTWDIQNLWQMGVFPTLEVYRQLRPLIGCVHLKGGRTEDGGRTLVQASSLQEASWPVIDIVRAAIADGVAPFLCLNPSHGRKPPGFDVWETARQDIAFLRANLGSDL